MKITRFVALSGLAGFLAVASLAVSAAPAQAQATRTFVSGVGNDADPCSRTAPCRTFAGAFNKTAPGGEINCLDPGGYGGLTINKSISIVCTYTEGGSLVAGAGVNGITVNAGTTDSVFLRGIDFHGATTATNGLRILAGGSVHLQDSVIRRFNASSGLGIRITPSTATRVTIVDTTIESNGSGATGGGILVQPTGAGGSARVLLNRVTLANNANNALHVDTTGGSNAAGVTVVVRDSTFSGSSNGIHFFTPVGGTAATAMITDSLVFNNTTNGILGNGANVRVRVARTTITGNNVGVNPGGSSNVNDLGGNLLIGNTNNNTFN
ncbi:MAG TPA: hypothetical protein VEB68_11840 [Croceibacterium sp.]|nr:hypothetical protein [Croceibacterium sp.]